MLPLFCTLLGAFSAYLLSGPKRMQRLVYQLKSSRLGRSLYLFLNKRWLFDKVYNDFVAENSLHFGYHISFKTLDKGCFEILGPYGISNLFQRFTTHVARLQSGMIYHYAVFILIGLTLLISVIGLWDFLELFVDNRLYFLFITTFLFYNYYTSVRREGIATGETQ